MPARRQRLARPTCFTAACLHAQCTCGSSPPALPSLMRIVSGPHPPDNHLPPPPWPCACAAPFCAHAATTEKRLRCWRCLWPASRPSWPTMAWGSRQVGGLPAGEAGRGHTALSARSSGAAGATGRPAVGGWWGCLAGRARLRLPNRSQGRPSCHACHSARPCLLALPRCWLSCCLQPLIAPQTQACCSASCGCWTVWRPTAAGCSRRQQRQRRRICGCQPMCTAPDGRPSGCGAQLACSGGGRWHPGRLADCRP